MLQRSSNIKLDSIYRKCTGEYVMTLFFCRHDKTKEELLIFQYLEEPHDVIVTTKEDFTAIIPYNNEFQPKFKLLSTQEHATIEKEKEAKDKEEQEHQTRKKKKKANC